MKKEIEIAEYNINKGIQLSWENNFKIEVSFRKGEVLIQANKEGLYSLANHFLNLAQEKVPDYTHIHLDKYNSLEGDSVDLIVERIS